MFVIVSSLIIVNNLIHFIDETFTIVLNTIFCMEMLTDIESNT